jgi:hypothetical protein
MILSSSASAFRLLALVLAATLIPACGGPREERYDRPAARAAAIELDHVWIVTGAGATERALLDEAGFRLSGNRILFENTFLELRPGLAAGASPFGIGFRRTAGTPAALPFEQAPGGASQVALVAAATPVDVAANRAAIAAAGAAAEPFLHSNGARRVTGLRVTAPSRAGLPPASTFVNLSGAAELRVGGEWLMELELDHGSQNQELDLRPRLPLVIRF